jgi:hypothetical protein
LQFAVRILLAPRIRGQIRLLNVELADGQLRPVARPPNSAEWLGDRCESTKC